MLAMNVIVFGLKENSNVMSSLSRSLGAILIIVHRNLKQREHMERGKVNAAY